MSRVFGFEILPAPFVISHLQIGMLLHRLGAPLADESDERAGVYLTNALTGWTQGLEDEKPLPMAELEEERDAAGHVKRQRKIMVVLGNPPYNAFAGMSPAEEGGLVEVYKRGLVTEWGVKKSSLDDLYVRFFRIAERRIADMSLEGIVCFISSFSYLGGPSYVVMRKHLLDSFDCVWVDNMNGDSRETGKVTPEGLPDPSVFSTAKNREGIRVGTAISLFARRRGRAEPKQVEYREFWGREKNAALLASLPVSSGGAYERLQPAPDNRFLLRRIGSVGDYAKWPRVPELAANLPYNGPVERRAFALISIDREPLAIRMQAYLDSSISDEDVAKLHAALMMTGNRIVGPEARARLLEAFAYDESRIVRYPFKPFDVRWCYLENLRPLFSEPSPQLLAQRQPGNTYLVTRDTADKADEGAPFYFTRHVCDYDCISGHARHFPSQLKVVANVGVDGEKPSQSFLDLEATSAGSQLRPNLSSAALTYLRETGGGADLQVETSESLWHHVLAVGMCDVYFVENAGALQQDWPRVPLPATRRVLLASAELGRTSLRCSTSRSPWTPSPPAPSATSCAHRRHRHGR